MPTIRIAFLAVLLMPTVARAGSFPTIYAFGDSLSDAGNAWIATGGTEPMAPPYALVNGYGVFSNGPVWVQDLSQALGLGTLRPSLAGGTDFAVGGASAGAFGGYAGSPGDLLPSAGNPLADSQIGMFQAAVPAPAPNALYTLSIGSNDLDYIFSHDAGNPAQAVADASAVIGNIASFVGALAADGARNLVALNVPDLGKTPAALALGPAEAAAISSLVAGLDVSLGDTLEAEATADGIDLHIIDDYGLVDAAVADPARFGLTNVSDPCLVGELVCATPDTYLFWDEHHPTETGERLLATVALQAIPEPSTSAVLAGAILLLGLVRRRRGRARV